MNVNDLRKGHDRGTAVTITLGRRTRRLVALGLGALGLALAARGTPGSSTARGILPELKDKCFDVKRPRAQIKGGDR